jgi:alpha-beta hydrolase superfamily lysophospholipase
MSTGVRGDVPTASEIQMDLDAAIAHLRTRWGAQSVVILGESMGALVALNYAAKKSQPISAVIFVAPAVCVAAPQIFRFDSLKALPGLVFQTWPMIDLVGERLDDGSIDEAFKAARRNDPLAINNVGATYLLGISRLLRDFEGKAAAVTQPSLILHGKRDRILDPRGSSQLYRYLGATDKELHLIEDAHHTLFWDPATPRVFSIVRQWLQARNLLGP